MNRKLRVGVLFGGRSCEHDVSLQSAKAIVDALAASGHEVVPIGVTKQGQWVRLTEMAIDARRALDRSMGECVSMLPVPCMNPLIATETDNSDVASDGIDIVFPALHGPMGEDGTVQGLVRTGRDAIRRRRRVGVRSRHG